MKRKLFLFVLFLSFLITVTCFAQQYEWYAEEKLTVSNTVKTLSSEEYAYVYGVTRFTVTADPNSAAFQLNEVITDGTTGANGILNATDDANSPTYLDVYIKYNGLDSADFDPNNTLTGGTSGASCTLSASYTRGDGGTWRGAIAIAAIPKIAEVHILDNNIIWTSNLSVPVYSTTNASCYGEKQYVTDTFYLYGKQQIESFKAIRASASDAIIYLRYGK